MIDLRNLQRNILKTLARKRIKLTLTDEQINELVADMVLQFITELIWYSRHEII